ncbi:ABC-2 family transporter [Kribbella sp. VKM Ac-2569]|uniref:ABC transporter permease n=1 Tax=Kribbella sp. VKM Ac-2569 TaxID=2512220 RepID=UPI00102BCD19|nr:ABC transporter permease [Kribbella sp. VKM Ac-2569]RZT17581.1 ABC-2 family transporter [Kribbella sp. VKM Ac-2569]
MSAAILAVGTGSGLSNAVRSEWTKLWSVRSSWLNIVAAVVLSTLLGMQYGWGLAYDNTHLGPGEVAEQQPIGHFGASAMLIVQVVIAAFALLTVTSEYATGSIRSTLQWTPVRRDVVLAKAAVLAPVLFVYGIAMAALASVAGGLTAGSWADWNLTDLVVDLLSVGFYATAAGLFSSGVAWVVRSTAGTLTVAFLLLLVVPLMLGQASLRALVWTAALLPGGAGQNFLTGATDPLSPTLSAAILIAWAAGALVLGAIVLKRRDA